MRSKGKAYATTLSESNSSTSDSEDSCDEEGNFSAFMTIAHVKSSEDLNLLLQELGEHYNSLLENYNSLLEKSGEYARVAKATLKKIRRQKRIIEVS